MSAYLASILTVAGLWIILATSLNLVTGYAGQVSLAQAAFFGIGAYTAGILSTRSGVDFPLDLLPAIGITTACGAILGLPALRVRHDFLVLTTIGINFVVVAVFQYVDFFGGAEGIIGIPLLAFGDTLLTPQQIFYLVLGVTVLCVATQWLLLRTWFGLRMMAIRDDEDAAAATGIGVASTKIWAFALSGAYAGLAGGIFAHYLGSLFPSTFGFTESVTILAMLILGGEGTFIGPIVGAFVLRALPEWLRGLEDWRLIAYGGLLVLAIRYQPSGLLGHGSLVRTQAERLVARAARKELG